MKREKKEEPKKRNKASIAFSAFFKSLGQDISEGFKKHWVGMVGRIVMFVLPIAYILSTYLSKAPEKWALPSFVWLPLFLLLLVYWGKARSYLAIKVSGMETQNSIQKGKHAGAIILCKSIQACATALPFFLAYKVFKAIEEASLSVQSVFFALFVFEAIGGLLVVVDAIVNVIDYSEGENK